MNGKLAFNVRTFESVGLSPDDGKIVSSIYVRQNGIIYTRNHLKSDFNLKLTLKGKMGVRVGVELKLKLSFAHLNSLASVYVEYKLWVWLDASVSKYQSGNYIESTYNIEGKDLSGFILDKYGYSLDYWELVGVEGEYQSMPAGYTYAQTVKGHYSMRDDYKVVVRYDSNAGGDTVYKSKGDDVILKGISYGISKYPYFYRDTEIISSYNSRPDGSGITYELGQVTTFDAPGTYTLYAIWECAHGHIVDPYAEVPQYKFNLSYTEKCDPTCTEVGYIKGVYTCNQCHIYFTKACTYSLKYNSESDVFVSRLDNLVDNRLILKSPILDPEEVEIPALGHIFNEIPAGGSKCDDRECQRCHEIFQGEHYPPANSFPCQTRVCTNVNCKDVLIMPTENHVDLDGNGYCDNCGGKVYSLVVGYVNSGLAAGAACAYKDEG